VIRSLTLLDTLYCCVFLLCSDNAMSVSSGAGKTHSMIGGTQSFESRGIIPRAIGHIFRTMAARSDMSYQLSVSYVEIYNEHLFDLLAVKPPPGTLNPSVPHSIDLSVQEDANGGGVSIKGLVKRVVNSEQECLDALFEGDAQRSIGEHSLNESSTRSHVIYTIYVEMRSRVESREKIMHAKLNLVDRQLTGRAASGWTTRMRTHAHPICVLLLGCAHSCWQRACWQDSFGSQQWSADE
jgi:kinesin family protein 6/9